MINKSERNVLTVSEITRRVKSLLENQVGNLWIEGEVSNFRRPASGHCYFTLKDSSAQISAVLFRNSQKAGQVIRDGDMVRVYGRLTVYERGGNYQILVRTVEEAGKGDLQRKFEELKEKLQKEGLFAEEAKKDIPLLPQHIGIVTSATGAAIRDILNVISRRFPNLHIVIAPAKVQGDSASKEIAEAISLLNSLGGLDVIIVSRGGGSIEDLWAFNEEPVARAIWDSELPVISAVGHEIDFTISDFAADLRAPTPSAAAELVIGRKDDFEKRLTDSYREIRGLLRQSLLEYRVRYNAAADSYVFREPSNLIKRYCDRLDSIQNDIKHELINSTSEVAQRIDDASHRLSREVLLKAEKAAGRLEQLGSSLIALNPEKVLMRGYSITKGQDGKCLKSVAEVEKGQPLVTVLADGEIDSTVNHIQKT